MNEKWILVLFIFIISPQSFLLINAKTRRSSMVLGNMGTDSNSNANAVLLVFYYLASSTKKKGM